MHRTLSNSAPVRVQALPPDFVVYKPTSTSVMEVNNNVLGGDESNDAMQITCFTEEVHGFALHFQIVRLQKQIYVWIGCNSTKFGHLYAAATTRPNNMTSVTPLFGGGSDNVGSSIARHLVLKTGINVVLACNIPKDSPLLEANAERKLMEKLKDLGYIKQ